jgi:hypothetical protein
MLGGTALFRPALQSWHDLVLEMIVIALNYLYLISCAALKEELVGIYAKYR